MGNEEEFKVGEKINLEVQEVENISCPSCFFWNKEIGCTNSIVECFADRRSDGKNKIRSSLTDDEQKQAIWIAIRAIDTCTENGFIVED